MAATSNRKTTIILTGDVSATHVISAAANVTSPAAVEIKSLASGANTITVPTGGTVPKAVTIIPPTGNQDTLTLKGVTGDTGIALHLTDPFTISLATSVTTFVITAGDDMDGVRFYWT
jgi:hypothetical protein